MNDETHFVTLSLLIAMTKCIIMEFIDSTHCLRRASYWCHNEYSWG